MSSNIQIPLYNRLTLQRPLTISEFDQNFEMLNDFKIEKGAIINEFIVQIDNIKEILRVFVTKLVVEIPSVYTSNYRQEPIFDLPSDDLVSSPYFEIKLPKQTKINNAILAQDGNIYTSPEGAQFLKINLEKNTIETKTLFSEKIHYFQNRYPNKKGYNTVAASDSYFIYFAPAHGESLICYNIWNDEFIEYEHVFEDIPDKFNMSTPITNGCVIMPNNYDACLKIRRGPTPDALPSLEFVYIPELDGEISNPIFLNNKVYYMVSGSLMKIYELDISNNNTILKIDFEKGVHYQAAVYGATDKIYFIPSEMNNPIIEYNYKNNSYIEMETIIEDGYNQAILAANNKIIISGNNVKNILMFDPLMNTIEIIYSQEDNMNISSILNTFDGNILFFKEYEDIIGCINVKQLNNFERPPKGVYTSIFYNHSN